MATTFFELSHPVAESIILGMGLINRRADPIAESCHQRRRNQRPHTEQLNQPFRGRMGVSDTFDLRDSNTFVGDSSIDASEWISESRVACPNLPKWPFSDLRNAKPNVRNEVAKRTLGELTGYSLLEPWYTACDTKLLHKLLKSRLTGPHWRIRIS